jgi:hypothetical protein
LGGDIPYEEQLHWRSYNIEPDGSISQVAFRRALLADPSDPEQADLLFKLKFERFQLEWIEKYSWHLFRPLVTEDKHFYKSIRIPMTEDLAEFDQLVLCLTKVLIDSLNDKALQQAIEKDESGAKSIRKLDLFLEQKTYPERERDIEFLRDLQKLRSASAAHRKGKNFLRIAKRFGLDTKPSPEIYEDILRDSILFLDTLRSHFLD